MPILVRCACDEEFQVGEHLAGQTVRCPVCGHRETVPTFVPTSKSKPGTSKIRTLVIVAVLLALIVIGGSIYGVVRIVKPPLDSGQRLVYDHLLKFENDPSSVEFVEWRPTIRGFSNAASVEHDSMVYVVIRAKNDHGALVTTPRMYFFKDGRIVDMLDRTAHNIGLAAWVDSAYRQGVVLDKPMGK
jgi:hypothetical protein